MKVVALLSGGKDSIYNVMKCIQYGHEMICVGNLRPAPSNVDELDSEMYQTVGWNGVELIAKALDLPFYFSLTHGKSIQRSVSYNHRNIDEKKMDEVEDLFRLLQKIKRKHPEINAVSTGAILSNYQRTRVESVCSRLDLVNLSYLWQRRDQHTLLKEMIDNGIDAIIIKCASMGLHPNDFLGKSIRHDGIYDKLIELNTLYQMNVCGEGGEYETFVVDAPLFKKFKISIDESSICGDIQDPIAPNAHLKLIKLSLIPKETQTQSNIDKIQSFEEKIENECDNDFMPFTPPQMIDSTNICNYGAKNGVFQFVAHPNVYPNLNVLFNALQRELNKYDLTIDNLFYTQLFLNDIAQFKMVNAAYKSYFKRIFPPSRLCCKLDLNMKHRVSLEALGYKYKYCGNKAVFDCLHIESISEWAPNCIGPYSQSSKIGNKFIFCAGVIGLIAGTMKMVSNTKPIQQMDVTWNNINAILTAFDSHLCLAIHHNIFVISSKQKDVDLLRVIQRSINKHIITDTDFNAVIIYVPDLPKHALMEVQTLSTTKQCINHLKAAKAHAKHKVHKEKMEINTRERKVKLKYAHIKRKRKKREKVDIHEICTDYKENEIGTFFMVKTKTIYNLYSKWCSVVSLCELSSQHDANNISKLIKSALSQSILYLNGYGFMVNQIWTETSIVFLRLYYHSEALEPKTLLNRIESCFQDLGIVKIPAISLIPCRGLCFANHKEPNNTNHNFGLYMLHCFLYQDSSL